MKKLLLATNNSHKVGELRVLLENVQAEIVTLDQFPSVGTLVEDQETLEGNALKKAVDVFHLTNVATLADDSGLEVDYLNGSPGVYSSRYAGPGASYSDNCKKLLLEMKGVPLRRRGAQFRCFLAFVGGPRFERTAEGICSGVITEVPRGDRGFGYDPLFKPSGYGWTLAEMDPSLKNKLSHRAKAVQKIEPTLVNFFTSSGG